LDAFVNRDTALARQVITEDDRVDELHERVWQETVQTMTEEPQSVPGLAHLFLIAKYLERIGDHSSNIAEMVVFLVEGKDIRHFEKVKKLRESAGFGMKQE
jgi:phosphate transport system protein